MDAPKQRDDAIGIFLLNIVVNIEKRVTDQLHPELFDLMNDLKLQFVAIA